MNPQRIHALLAYNRWANRRLLAAASRLSLEEFTRELGAGHAPPPTDFRLYILPKPLNWGLPSMRTQLSPRSSKRNPSCPPVMSGHTRTRRFNLTGLCPGPARRRYLRTRTDGASIWAQHVRRLANRMEFDVFGSRIIVERTSSGWAAFYPAEEGKRRPAHWLLIPSHLTESEIGQYLADYCHEGASPEHPEVKRLR